MPPKSGVLASLSGVQYPEPVPKTPNQYHALPGSLLAFGGLLVMAAVGFAWDYLDYAYEGRFDHDQLFGNREAIPASYALVLGSTAVLGGLLLTVLGAWMIRRFARQRGIPAWNAAAGHALVAFLIPSLVGALFSLIAVFKYGLFGLAAPLSLLFVGLGLAQAAVHSLAALRFLGLAIAAVGIGSLFMPRESLLFWGLGFGILPFLTGAWVWYGQSRTLR